MPAPDNLHALQAVFLFLLLLVAVFAALAKRINVPYPILLVVAGLAISFIPHVPRVRLNPELVFLIFLPPLLYASAWQTNFREFKANLVSISMLAIGLVGFTVLGVAFFADHFITALDFKSGFILGAVVATTDAIAAAAIAQSVGLPQRIVDLLEGESLVNDATGLLALEFGLDLLLRDQAPTLAGGTLRLLWLALGGSAVGLLFGGVTAWLERWIDDGPIEMVISLIVPYTAYLAAEQLHASGVLAVVACGLFLSRKSVGFFSPETRLQIMSGWSALNFILNGLVFILIGLQLPYVLAGIQQYSRWTLLEYGAVFSAILVLLRLAWVYPGAHTSAWINRTLFHRRRAQPDPRQVFVVGWTGMRGVIALAAALSLPETLANGQPFAQRNLIVFLTFSIILSTLVVQGLSLPAIIRALGLAGKGASNPEEREGRRIVLEAAIHFLEDRRHALPEHTSDGEAHNFEDLLHHYRHRLEALDEGEPAADSPQSPAEAFRLRRELVRETAQVERHTLIRLRDEGAIGDDILRRLEYELDLRETSVR